LLCQYLTPLPPYQPSNNTTTSTAPEASLFAQQFSHHGYVGLEAKDASSFHWRDGPASFKFWGSGRRHCQGVLFSVVTPPYHDLVRRFLPGFSDSRLDVRGVLFVLFVGLGEGQVAVCRRTARLFWWLRGRGLCVVCAAV
jgi:hypothetical protein